MISNINSVQVIRWISVLRDNLAAHRRRRVITDEERLQFLSTQYDLLFLINKAIEGKVIFVGTPPIGENNGRISKGIK